MVFKYMSCVVCEGVLDINDRDNNPPDLLVRASSMGLHVLPPLLYT